MKFSEVDGLHPGCHHRFVLDHGLGGGRRFKMTDLTLLRSSAQTVPDGKYGVCFVSAVPISVGINLERCQGKNY